MICEEEFECAICQCITFEGEEHYGEYCILCGIVVERLEMRQAGNHPDQKKLGEEE